MTTCSRCGAFMGHDNWGGTALPVCSTCAGRPLPVGWVSAPAPCAEPVEATKVDRLLAEVEQMRGLLWDILQELRGLRHQV